MNTSPSIFFMTPPGEVRDWMWRGASRRRAAELGYTVRLCDIEAPVSSQQWAEMLRDVDALLTTWGSPRLDAAVLRHAQALRIVGHVGGSVAPIVSPELFARGIQVCTANTVMARSVAEWSLMMTLVGLRRVLRYAQFGVAGVLDWDQRRGTKTPQDAVIGIWGYGDVSRWLIRLLRAFEPREILVHDEYLTPADADKEGVRSTSLEEVFARADVVHCLAALTVANKGRVDGALLASLGDDAILLNCGRAALIQEDALISALQGQRFTAILDVFEVEPLAVDHPYRRLPNVILTPHNAGHGRDEHYLGTMLEEFHRFFHGQPLKYGVTAQRALAMTDPALMRHGG